MTGRKGSVKVAHITTVPGTLGFLTGLVRYTKERGMVVHAISSPGDRLDSFGDLAGVPTHGVSMARSITPFRDVRSLLELTRTIRANHLDIVHAHTPKAGLLGMMAAILARRPVRIYHLHGLPYTAATGRRERLLRLTERVSCALAQRVICVSASARERAIRDGVCSPDKIVVFGAGSVGGIDAETQFNPGYFGQHERLQTRDRLGIPATARVIGFVGRIVRDKGVHELAAAWGSLKDLFPDLHLVMVGQVEPQDPVDPEVLRSLTDDPRVRLVGRVTDPREFYAIMDVLALPTYREGFGNVNMEAAAMGVPVVSTSIPGCVDSVQDGVTGTLVPARDADALATAIARYLDDPELCERHGKAGRRRMLEEFRPEHIWQSTYEEYCRLLRATGRKVSIS